jgi:GNAT superfamily N-acetyltransferase
MSQTFSILAASAGDVPSFTPISTAAFRNDTHTLMKDQSRGLPPGEVYMPADHVAAYIDLPDKCKVLKAVNEKGEIIGWCCWGLWNYDGTHPLVRASVRFSFERSPTAEMITCSFQPPSGSPSSPTFPPPSPLPPTATSLERLEHLTDTSMAEYQTRLSPLGQRVLYIISIIVSPEYQGKGVGSAFIKWGTDKADLDGVRCWVHASEAGWPAFHKAGFEAVGTLDIDLDEYATGPRKFADSKPDEPWGPYTFRYMRREPRKMK